MLNPTYPQRILLVICGSIAAYKALELIRELRKFGCEIDGIMTEGAKQFITPLAVAALTGRAVYDELFSLKDEVEMGHIALARNADVILIAPASADFIAKVAHGFADDLASTVMLAANWQAQKIIFAPAMNPQMWANEATQANIAILQQRGALMVQPENGEAACGETGVGRLASLDKIMAAIKPSNKLAGKHFIVTAGGTQEKIDPVRFIGNYSSGKQGFAIAESLHQNGAKVTLIYGATSKPPAPYLNSMQALSVSEMLARIEETLPADGIICAAAVADWQVATPNAHKLKKNGNTNLQLELKPTIDILATVANHPQRPRLVVGFAAETENMLENAQAKLQRKNCDWLLANNVAGGAIFGKDETEVTFLTKTEQQNWGELSKIELASRLTHKITEFFAHD
jgi:phosphopantothenoylcysteine decarboxylase/phosphopantothenate--cysteine ligase